MRRFLQWRWIAVGGIQLVLLVGVFFGGAFAHRQCVFPFCQGYISEASDMMSTLMAASAADDGEREFGLRSLGRDTIDTNLHEVVAHTYEFSGGKQHEDRWDSRAAGRDGGIDNLGDGLLLASSTGDLLYLDEDMNSQVLSLSIPFSREAFMDDIRETEYAEATPERPPVYEGWFSVKGIKVIEEAPDQYRLLAAYHHWNSDEACYTLRMSQITLQHAADSVTAAGDASWEEVYETEPCLELEDRDHPFGGLHAGGRITPLSDDEVLLSVGDHYFDGTRGENLPQDTTAAYGKTVRVNLDTGASHLYTIGHRNPQGLHVDAQGRIWSTEHGPDGGDELNLIEEGENYGWPNVSYGTESDDYNWPFLDNEGSHEGYTRPVFAWVPSRGISQLISVKEDLFERWQGDLLVGSLSGVHLFRTRVRDGRVVLSEPIEIGWRIRDLVERPDGTVAIKTDSGVLVFLRPSTEGEEPDYLAVD